jgi:hypothetical protein
MGFVSRRYRSHELLLAESLKISEDQMVVGLAGPAIMPVGAGEWEAARDGLA